MLYLKIILEHSCPIFIVLGTKGPDTEAGCCLAVFRTVVDKEGLFRKGLLRRTRVPLCIFGALSAIVIYGGILNPAAAAEGLEEITDELNLTALPSHTVAKVIVRDAPLEKTSTGKIRRSIA